MKNLEIDLRQKFLNCAERIRLAMIDNDRTEFNMDDHHFLCWEKNPFFVPKNDHIGIFLPLPVDEWPVVFQRILDNTTHPFMHWPARPINYVVDAFKFEIPKCLLCFGYVMEGNTIKKSTFFRVFKLINGEPQGFVIDPLSVKLEKNIDCYVGVDIPADLINNFYFNLHQNPQNPFDVFWGNEVSKSVWIESVLVRYIEAQEKSPGYFVNVPYSVLKREV